MRDPNIDSKRARRRPRRMYLALDKGSVTEIVCHHDGRIQRTKIEGGDGRVVVACGRQQRGEAGLREFSPTCRSHSGNALARLTFLRVNNGGTLVLLLRALAFNDGHDELMLAGVTQKLRDNLRSAGGERPTMKHSQTLQKAGSPVAQVPLQAQRTLICCPRVSR